MCGIIAIYNKSNDVIYTDDINNMLNAISHRGNDQISVKKYSKCTVGFRRLAITELESEQPKGEKWIIYLNGEIYNYKDLGFDGPECEVISKGLEKYGIDFVKKLNGMFFILAINGDDVYIFRDRYGIKPIYYWENKECIIISSEIKAIIKHSAYKLEINIDVEKQWNIFNNSFTNETLFKDIIKVEKGITWHLNSNSINKYWAWKFNPTPINYNIAVNKIKELFINAVNKQIPNEVIYGSCLSGGIDSNIIVSLLKNEAHTFTVGFSKEDNESKLALLNSKNKKHHQIFLDTVIDLEKTIFHLEDLRLGASWANFSLYKEAAKFVKVLFDGAGGDELFSGYEWRYNNKNYYDVLNRTKQHDVYCEKLYDTIFPIDTLEKRFEFDANYFLEGLFIVGDKLSMAHTIEVRFPFLDNDFVDFCLTLPNEYKQNKKILKDAFKYLLPEEILNNKKQGFSSPDLFNGNGNQAKNWADVALIEWKKLFINMDDQNDLQKQQRKMIQEFYNSHGKFDESNQIHPTAIIYDNVKMGKNNIIGAYAVIGSNGEIRNCKEFKGHVEIGDGNIISELVTIQKPATDTITKIGNNNLIMAHSHVGHDVIIGNDCEICTGVILGGYVIVEDKVKIKLGATIRNRKILGKGSLIGLGSSVVKDVLPDSIVYGNPAKNH